jgi:hypothetical protein
VPEGEGGGHGWELYACLVASLALLLERRIYLGAESGSRSALKKVKRF